VWRCCSGAVSYAQRGRPRSLIAHEQFAQTPTLETRRQVHFDEALWARVAQLAQQERRPISQLLRNIVADAVDGRCDRGQSAAKVILVLNQYKCIGCSPGKHPGTRTMVIGLGDDSRDSAHDRFHASLFGRLSGHEGTRGKISVACIECSDTQRQKHGEEKGDDEKRLLAAFHGPTPSRSKKTMSLERRTYIAISWPAKAVFTSTVNSISSLGRVLAAMSACSITCDVVRGHGPVRRSAVASPRKLCAVAILDR
jgi:hypothetical protein